MARVLQGPQSPKAMWLRGCVGTVGKLLLHCHLCRWAVKVKGELADKMGRGTATWTSLFSGISRGSVLEGKLGVPFREIVGKSLWQQPGKWGLARSKWIGENFQNKKLVSILMIQDDLECLNLGLHNEILIGLLISDLWFWTLPGWNYRGFFLGCE